MLGNLGYRTGLVLEGIKGSINRRNFNMAASKVTAKEPVWFKTVIAKDDGLGVPCVVAFNNTGFVEFPILYGDNARQFLKAVKTDGKGKISFDPLIIEGRTKVKELPQISVAQMQRLISAGKAMYLSDFM